MIFLFSLLAPFLARANPFHTCGSEIQLPDLLNQTSPCPADGSFLEEPKARRLQVPIPPTHPPPSPRSRLTTTAQPIQLTEPPTTPTPTTSTTRRTTTSSSRSKSKSRESSETTVPSLTYGPSAVAAATTHAPVFTYGPSALAAMTTRAPDGAAHASSTHASKVGSSTKSTRSSDEASAGSSRDRSKTSGHNTPLPSYPSSHKALAHTNAPFKPAPTRKPTPAPTIKPTVTNAPATPTGIPDCNHELAVKLLWEEMPRDDLSQGVIKQDVNYRMAVYRASPTDMAARDEPATLHRIDIAYPALHTVAGVRPRAELILHHTFTDAKRINLVLPVDVGPQESPVLSWLAEASEPCGMFSSLMGSCTSLQAVDLIPERSKMIRYDMPGCAETFVVLAPLLGSQAQIDALQQIPRPQFIGTPLAPSINGVVLGEALPLNMYFSVWSKEEMKLRDLVYKTLWFLGVLFVGFAYLYVKRRTENNPWTRVKEDPTSNQDDWFKQVLKHRRIRACLVLDHFFMFTAAILIPALALKMEHISERHGMPWEYHALFFLCIVAHTVHELIWFSQVSPKATRRVSRLEVLKNSTFGVFCMLDYYMTVACIALALLMGSPLAYASAVVFAILTLVGQLCFYTFEIFINPCVYDMHDQVDMFFRPRSFEVMHSVLYAHFADTGYLGEMEMRVELMSSAYAFLKFIADDLTQCSITILFAVFYGMFPICRATIIVKLCLAAYGPCKTYSEITLLRHKAAIIAVEDA